MLPVCLIREGTIVCDNKVIITEMVGIMVSLIYEIHPHFAPQVIIET